MTTNVVRVAIARGFAIASGALAIYVAYAHVASCKTTRAHLEEPVSMRFDSADWQRSVQVLVQNGLTTTVEGDRLRVRGTTDGVLELAGPSRRLREATVRLRLRAHDASPYDLAVGIERVDVDESFRVTWGLRNDPERPAWRFFGDVRGSPPAAAQHFERQRFVRFDDTDRARDHEVELRISPELHAVLGSVDGVAVSSELAGWDDGVMVRPVVALRGRASGRPLDVEVFGVEYEPVDLALGTRPQRIDEHFKSAILDPRTWRVLRADDFAVSGKWSVGGGLLRLQGHALRATREDQAIAFVGPTVDLGSFHATVAFKANRLHRARFFFGLSNLLVGLADWRAFDVGLVDGLTQTEPYAAGHWEGDGQFVVSPFSGALSGVTEGELAIDYDAASGIGRASLNGQLVTAQHLDLQPPEPVQIHFGGRVATEEGAFDVNVSSVKFEPIDWRATGEIARHAAPPPPLPDAAPRGFTDDFATDSTPAYHLLQGAAAWESASHSLRLGPSAVGYSEIVRGRFEEPVTVTGSIHVPAQAARGDYDSAGLMATDRTGDVRWFGVIWYGTKLATELHLTRHVPGRADQFLAKAPIKLEPGKNYWVKMRVDRNNVYARAWPNEPNVLEPEEWMASAPLDAAWSASGGVGFVANAPAALVGSLKVE